MPNTKPYSHQPFATVQHLRGRQTGVQYFDTRQAAEEWASLTTRLLSADRVEVYCNMAPIGTFKAKR